MCGSQLVKFTINTLTGSRAGSEIIVQTWISAMPSKRKTSPGLIAAHSQGASQDVDACRFAFEQIVRVGEDGTVVHCDRMISGKGPARLGDQLSVSDIQKLK